jgi:DNA modification methylase
LEVLKTFTDNSINCCITSPPYWGLRDYGKEEQIGLEKTPEDYVAKMVLVFEEVRRVLKPDGTLWLNLGDSYISGKSRYSTKAQTLEGGGEKEEKYGSMHNGNKPDLYYHPFFKDKDLAGIPWRVAFELQKLGWYLRQDIIWHKPNPMPESVTDRCTKAHEYIFLLSKSSQYYFDYESIQEIATGFDMRKDTMMKGSNKYKNSVIPGLKEHTMASKGHERWKFKGTGTFGNLDGELNGLHSGKKYNPKFKNLQPDGQQSNTMHLIRAEGEADEVYPIRNKRSVWTVPTKPYLEAHFATFPEDLIVDCIKAGCPKDGLILDPFMGAGTTALVCRKLGRNYVGIELNEKYIKIANDRLYNGLGMFL